MTVFELIEVLCGMPQGATAVVEDPCGRDEPAVRALRPGDVQRVAVRLTESNGVALVELGGPHTAVLLGSLE